MKVKLGSFLSEVNEKTTKNNQYPVLTSSKSGLYLQSNYFNKQVASKDNTGYKIIKRNQFTYRAMSDTGKFFPNMLDCADVGIVSPAYPVFEISDKSVIIPEYLKYFFKSNNFQHSIASFAQGSTRTSVKFNKMKTIIINIPSIETQMETIEIIKKVSTIITHLHTQLEKLDLLVKARFVEMFGDPVSNPMGWKKKNLKDVVTDDCSISYGIVQTGDEQKSGIPVFRPVDIVNHIPKLEELKKTTKEISDKYKRTILKGRELLITVRANIADTCIIGEKFKGCNVGRGIVPIRTQENTILLEFLKNLLDNKHLNDEIKSKAKGITLIQLNMEDLRIIELIIPPIELQKQYVSFVKQVDKSRTAIQNELKKAQMLFDSLMQEYFG